MVIMDGISSYFAATDQVRLFHRLLGHSAKTQQVEFAMISLVNRVMQSISRVSRRYNRTKYILFLPKQQTLT